MITIKITRIVTILFLFPFMVAGQTTKEILADYPPFLKEGDNIANLQLKNLLNYPVKTAKISNFREKQVILDFWNTNCTSCIESWPKLLDIQKAFDDKIQIILVNPWEDELTVRNLFKKRTLLTGINMLLPTVCGDTTLLHSFNISGVPLEAWVGKDGIINYFSAVSSVELQQKCQRLLV